jgi:hypothetical protein
MPRPSIAVRLNNLGRGTVTIDGEPLDGVRAVTIKAEVNCLPTVVIELLADAVDFQQGETAEGVPDAAADR